jgi:subtilisin family serine protease
MAGLLENPDDVIARLADQPGIAGGLEADAAIPTGRTIVTFREDAADSGAAMLRELAGGGLARASDFGGAEPGPEDLATASALMFDELGIALVDEATGAALAATGASESGGAPEGAILEPEILMFPAGQSADEFLRGFAAAANAIRDGLAGPAPEPPAPAPDTGDVSAEALGNTWGVVAVRANSSRFSGAGIRVAILDTGFDFRHPDFPGRVVAERSFIAGQTSQDGNGHGTHCTGSACGPRAPAGTIPRYGCAHGAQVLIGKVLTNAGGGTSGTVLAGMNWAIANGCQLISMSLSGGGGPYAYYTQAGQVALSRGLLIVAAAGNDSRRPGVVRPCGAPANSPTIMAVAALEPNLTTAPYSNGGKIEIAGPGSSVFSSWPMPQRYRTISGTSMATPHVAGVGAMLAQAGGSGMRGLALWRRLQATARPLPGRPDVGAGLVQAPQ